MSTLRTEDKVIAVLCADIHLSLKPPVARSEEPDWFEAMKRPLQELSNLADEHHAPIICAGDVFDNWYCSPELINFALQHLPKMYAIPGQHDLPLHNYDLIYKSAFWTLVETEKVQLLEPNHPYRVGKTILYGFPYGFPIKPLKNPEKDFLHIAVIHDYLWIEGSSYPNAPTEKNVSKTYKNFVGYDVIISGDNHQSFCLGKG